MVKYCLFKFSNIFSNNIVYLHSTAELLSQLQFISMPNTFTLPIRPYRYWLSVLHRVLSQLFQNTCSSICAFLEAPPQQSRSEKMCFCLCCLESRFKLCPERAHHSVCLNPYLEESSLLESRPITREFFFLLK